MQKVRGVVVCAVAAVSVSACRASQILNVPPPAGVVTSSAIHGQSSAEAAFYTARTDLFGALGGYDNVMEVSAWLTDEFTVVAGEGATMANVDARQTTLFGGFSEPGDMPLQALLGARSELLLVLPSLEQYETGAGEARVGEVFALAGYAELLMAEDYCAGVPLSQALPGGGFLYGGALSTDSLLSIATSHFDSALAHASGNDTISAFASVGLGRALMDLGQYTAAATAVGNVSTMFVYDMMGEVDGTGRYEANFYEGGINPDYFRCPDFIVADREGTNGLNYRSAVDPRLVLDSTVSHTCDGSFSEGGFYTADPYGLPDSTFYYPVKFGNPSEYIPLATGIEARLIGAESALEGGDPTTWLTDLNTLRSSSCGGGTCTLGTGQVPGQTAGLPPLSDPTTDTGRVSLMFHERAFWLFGTGTRLGDLRRLIRQYHRPAETVFPTGAYAPGVDPSLNVYFPSPLTTYGSDVNLTLPTPQSSVTTGNPNYKGCVTSTSSA